MNGQCLAAAATGSSLNYVPLQSAAYDHGLNSKKNALRQTNIIVTPENSHCSRSSQSFQASQAFKSGNSKMEEKVKGYGIILVKLVT